MSRNSIMILLAFAGVAAGLLFWQQWRMTNTDMRRGALASALEATENDPHARIVLLDSILAEYPGADDVQHVGRHHLLQAHVDAGSDGLAMMQVANEFLAVDSSWSVKYSIASAFAERGVNTEKGLELIREATGVIELIRHSGDIAQESWLRQKRQMLGYCRNITGKLLVAGGNPAEGVREFRAAVDSVPYSYEFHEDLARGYESRSHLDSALNEFMSVVRLKYDHDARVDIQRLYPVVHRRSPDGVLDTLVANAREARRQRILAAEEDTARAQTFDVQGLDSVRYTLDSLRGRVIVLDVFSVRNAPCFEQLPRFQQAFEANRNRSDVVFLAVSLDDDQQEIRSFIEHFGYTFPVAMRGQIFDIQRMYTTHQRFS